METSAVMREVRVPAGRLGLPGDDPEVLEDGYNLLVLLRPAPVVARVAAVTAVMRADVVGHSRRADELSRFLTGRGVPVVEPYGPEPVRHGTRWWRWPEEPTPTLHGDSRVRNVLTTPGGPVWNDFEDAWRGPVGWDVACTNSLFDEPIPYPAADLAFWLELRGLYGTCWSRVRDLHRTSAQVRNQARWHDRGRSRTGGRRGFTVRLPHV